MENLKLAIQKSGRLYQGSVELLEKCGLSFEKSNNKLKASVGNFPIEFFFLRDDDIPKYVAKGVADIGIVGENELVEKNVETSLIKKLGFSKCRLSIAIPKSENYTDLNYLQNKKIATSYPVLLKKFLDEKEIKAEIHTISGSVEIAPSIGLADAICDLVSSGSTLLHNGLKEVEPIFYSEAVLVANNLLNAEKKAILDKLLFRIEAVQKAKNTKYILLNAPNSAIGKISEILPGLSSPTIMPLANKDWSSIHAVVEENDFWDLIENLKEAGAKDILVSPVEKMIV